MNNLSANCVSNQLTSLLIDFHRARPFERFEEGKFVGIVRVGDDDPDFAFATVFALNRDSWIAKALGVEVDGELGRLLNPIEAWNDFNVRWDGRRWFVGERSFAQRFRAD